MLQLYLFFVLMFEIQIMKNVIKEEVKLEKENYILL